MGVAEGGEAGGGRSGGGSREWGALVAEGYEAEEVGDLAGGAAPRGALRLRAPDPAGEQVRPAVVPPGDGYHRHARDEGAALELEEHLAGAAGACRRRARARRASARRVSARRTALAVRAGNAVQ